MTQTFRFISIVKSHYGSCHYRFKFFNLFNLYLNTWMVDQKVNINRLRLLSLAFHILNASSNCFDLIIEVYIYITY